MLGIHGPRTEVLGPVTQQRAGVANSSRAPQVLCRRELGGPGTTGRWGAGQSEECQPC